MLRRNLVIGFVSLLTLGSVPAGVRAGEVADGFPIYFTNSLSTTEVCGTASGDIDHDWVFSSPGTCNTDYFYGSGSAYFYSSVTGIVTFCGTFDDRLNLYIDDEYLFSATTEACAATRLTRGTCYELSLSYEEFTGLADLDVTWGPTEESQEVIPGRIFGASCADAPQPFSLPRILLPETGAEPDAETSLPNTL